MNGKNSQARATGAPIVATACPFCLLMLEDGSKAAARATDDWVHENPWAAVGVAAGVGLVLGVLISRR